MIEILRNRRSVRRFQDRPVEGEKLDLLKEALVRSPTSRSINPWEFIVVEDQEIIQERVFSSILELLHSNPPHPHTPKRYWPGMRMKSPTRYCAGSPSQSSPPTSTS